MPESDKHERGFATSRHLQTEGPYGQTLPRLLYVAPSESGMTKFLRMHHWLSLRGPTTRVLWPGYFVSAVTC